MTFAELKLAIRSDPNPNSRYERFLNKLPLPEFNKRGKDAAWDIWYFSDNTAFCRRTAGLYLTELDDLRDENKKSRKLLRLDDKADHHPNFTFDKFRWSFGNFCFYLYAALESFYHEANILYELRIERRAVSFSEIKKTLGNCSLANHMETFHSDEDMKLFIEYRNAFMHGYIFPISGSSDGRLFLKRQPRMEKFSFSDMCLDANQFVTVVFARVDRFICDGWRCFEKDQLT
ncbi:MAG: hypothetical protein QOF14_4366 [Hyphomicrobiales bacterium]|jgi:hypothetical protein|nr:hypothetical protein [Hyphomicrobiales bacterium]